MVNKQVYYTVHCYIDNIIFMFTTVYICVCADIPKVGLAIVKEGFVLDNVDAITLATFSVLRRMLTAGVAALPPSRSVESVCYIYTV